MATSDAKPPVVDVEHMSVHYRVPGKYRPTKDPGRDISAVARRLIGALTPPGIGIVHAVDRVSFSIAPGEALGLVGESGCGKSSVGRTLVRLETPVSGRVRVDGIDVAKAKRGELRRLRRTVQMVFQDPYASLDPRLTIAQIVSEPLRAMGIERRSHAREIRAIELLERCGLDAELVHRFPHELSGGQQQRAAIARALAPGPKAIVADEPVSALDVSVQAQIINLLLTLRDELSLSMLFIAHDLAVVRQMCQRIAVMYLGRIVEIAPAGDLVREPLHPYTKALIDAVPIPDPVKERGRARRVLQGEVPSPLNPPSGCRFHPRCDVRTAKCSVEEPLLKIGKLSHQVACHVVHNEGT